MAQIFEGGPARSCRPVARIQSMKNAILVLAASALLFAVTTAAHANPKTTFSAEQVFESCTEATVFACGMISPSGERFGTAHTRTQCSTYKFLPNGNLSLSFYPGMPDRGRYQIRKGYVHIEHLDQKGKVTHRQKLALSKDGKTLGEMKRVVVKAN